MFIPSYRFINFEEFFQPTCLFRPTGLLILSIVYSILYRIIILRTFPTYMFIPPYRFINFDELFPHTYIICRRQQIKIYCYDRVDKEGSRLERTLDFDSFDLGVNFYLTLIMLHKLTQIFPGMSYLQPFFLD